ncbi:hypothetical protein [Mesorhizobium sp. INR15]|uniref:hypothetical protein n=1 Tax=Mesorhizobium sp. INR15 TaxID=2654248 RepID=UPI0018967423|nr:hypothetical protein [Mesorhizobium sp. INR15]QPC95952.1 hypothetical protein GA829_36200 [Mesorhizobium sp. INR15]
MQIETRMVLPDITEEDCDSALMFACIDYMMASGRTPYIIRMFVAWYAAINPKTGAFYRLEAEIIFPNIVGLPRKDQKAVARSVAREWGKLEIMPHPTNDLTDNWTKLRNALR